MNSKQKFETLKTLNLPNDQYLITGSGHMGILGLKEIGDIDILVTDELWDHLSKTYPIKIQNGCKVIVFPGKLIEALGKDSFPYDPSIPSFVERFKKKEFIDRLPFESLEHVLFFKRKMGREKDLKDIALIEEWQMRNFSFRKVVRKDRELIFGWLVKPHISQFLHGEGLKNTLKDLEKCLSDSPSEYSHWLGLKEGAPFAYLITSEVKEDDTPLLKKWQTSGQAITLDLFIGDQDNMGQGLGPLLIKAFLREIDAEEVYIDPEIENARAVKAYKKAGFEPLEEFIPNWHPTPHLLMRWRR